MYSQKNHFTKDKMHCSLVESNKTFTINFNQKDKS